MIFQPGGFAPPVPVQHHSKYLDTAVRKKAARERGPILRIILARLPRVLLAA
jgi:hypothetical protein